MQTQLSHAIKSFKWQKHINIAIVQAKVKTALYNASDKEDPTWLIEWVIDNKLVGNIIWIFFLNYWHINQEHK